MAENVARKSFCQPVRLPTLSITSQVESKPLGTFLLAAKEVPKQQIRTGGGCVRASHAATAGCAASGHAPRAVRGSAAASVRAVVMHQALMAVRPNPHGGPRPVVATEGDVGWVCECWFVLFCRILFQARAAAQHRARASHSRQYSSSGESGENMCGPPLRFLRLLIENRKARLNTAYE